MHWRMRLAYEPKSGEFIFFRDPKENKMEQLINILIERLARNGMELAYIPAFIRNLANSIAENPYITIRELNDHLQLLGWDNTELDEYTLQLIIAIFESEDVHQPSFCFDHVFEAKEFNKLLYGKEKMPAFYPYQSEQI